MTDTAQARAADFDPMGRAVSQCPYPFYAALRHEAPVYRVPSGAFWIASTHEAAQEIFRQPAVFSNIVYGEIMQTPELRAVYLSCPTLSQADPPAHGPLRRIVDRFFTPARINAMEPAIRALADELIDGFADAGRADLVADFALPLAIMVLSDTLGVERSLRHTFKDWSNTLRLVPQGVYSKADEVVAAARIREVNDYLLGLLRERRAQPRDDVLSVLANAELDDGNGLRAVPDEQCISVLQQMVAGGYETTSSTISAGILQMIRAPALQQRLRDEPGFVDAYVEETLRIESPIQGLWRRVVSDTTVGGAHLPAGAILNIRIGSANRDESRFPHAAEFDTARPEIGQQLAFGLGIHICVGRTLARKDLKVAYDSIARRLDDIRIVPGTVLEYRHAFLERSLAALPVTFRRRA